MKTGNLRTLLSRAASAIDGPSDLSPEVQQQLLHDLRNCDAPDAHPRVGVTFPVLNGGFVKLVRFMGGDAAIVEAARLTAQSEGREVGSDRSLLRFLLRHYHTTPTEFFEIVLHVRCPMDVWRQWIRHRTANVNEYSTRYTNAIDQCLQTKPEDWRMQSKSNRQGSAGALGQEWPKLYVVAAVTSDEDGCQPSLAPDDDATRWGVFKFQTQEALDAWDFEKSELRHVHEGPRETLTPGSYLSAIEAEGQDDARSDYEERLEFGVAKEQARKDLPLSNFTEAYWKIDGNNLMNFLRLRMDGHAQKEIRDYATVIGEQILSQICPLLWEAFIDYVHEAMRLTRLDQIVINNLVKAAADELAEGMATESLPDDRKKLFNYLPPYSRAVFMEHGQIDEWRPIEKCRERDECWAKLLRLDLVKEDEAPTQ